MAAPAHPIPEGKSENGWRRWVKPGTQFPPEAGRYRLYVAVACPFAYRALLIRALKGLEDVIPITIVYPQKAQPRADKDYVGWEFRDDDPEFPECTKCPAFPEIRYVQDFYEKVGDFAGPFSVPILWDEKTGAIVNNESAEILRIFDGEFNDFAKNPTIRVSPEELLPQIDETNEWVHQQVFLGPLRMMYQIPDQATYDKSITDLTAAIDKVEGILSKQRYLLGDRFTEADLRLFVPLIMFDAVFVPVLKASRARIIDRPNVFNYVKEIYQMPGIASTVSFKQITHTMFRNAIKHNPTRVVGAPPITDYGAPHDRDRFPAKPLQ